MATKEWDPKTVVVTFGEDRLDGFADGSFIRGERNEDLFSVKVSADGVDGARIRNRNRSGKLTLTLLQSSSSNPILSALLSKDELKETGAPPKQLMVKDLAGNSLWFAMEAWIQKYPSQEYAKELSNREWVFESLEVEMVEGGL